MLPFDLIALKKKPQKNLSYCLWKIMGWWLPETNVDIMQETMQPHSKFLEGGKNKGKNDHLSSNSSPFCRTHIW